MRFLSLHLKGFRKHIDRDFYFTPGINLLRGANETGKCLSGDALVCTPQGLRRIDSFDPDGSAPQGFSPLEGTTVITPYGEERVTSLYKEAEQEVFQVRTRHGYELTGTPSHPLLVYNPETAEHSYRRIDELVAGDFLCIARGVEGFSKAYVKLRVPAEIYSTRSTIRRGFSDEEMTPDLARLCGYMLANGSGNGRTLSFSSHNPVLQEDFSSAARGLGINPALILEHGKPVGVRICSVNFKRFLEYIHAVDRYPTARYKSVPTSILSSPKDVQRVFLRALFDCDGHLGTKSFEWVSASATACRQVKTMLLSFGVVSTTKVKRVKGYAHDYMRTTISGRDLQVLFENVLFDSLKYTSPPQFWPSKNDVVPGLLSFIRRDIKDQVRPNGWLVTRDGRNVLNKLFTGDVGTKPQSNMQVETLPRIIQRMEEMANDLCVEGLDKIKYIADMGFFYSPVEEVTFQGTATVYDIEVPGSHSFLANGIVSHNSSTLEGLGYCCFGSDLLMDPFDEVISWQYEKKRAALKTKVVFDVGGQVYECSRSAAGAEIRRQGDAAPLATGHKEVTAVVEDLMGIPHGKATKTMLALQNDIRGVLSLGPTETAKFLESLGDFTEVDRLLQTLASRIVTGSTVPMEQQIEDLKTQIAEMPEIDLRKLPELEAQIANLKRQIQADTSALDNAQETLQQAIISNQALEMKRAHLQGLIRAQQQYQDSVARLRNDIAAADGCKEKIAELEAQDLKYRAWQVFNEMPKAPDVIWEGDITSLQAEIADLISKQQAYTQNIAVNKARAQALAKEKLSTPTCPYTKKVCAELGDPKVVEETNARIDAEILELQQSTSEAQRQLINLAEEIKTLQTIAAANDEVERWYAAYESFVKIDRSIVPGGLSWLGTVPEAVPPINMSELNRLKGVIATAETAQEKLKELQAIEYHDVAGELAALPDPIPTVELAEKVQTLKTSLERANGTLRQLETELTEIKTSSEQREWKLKEKTAAIDKIKDQIAEVQSNNALLREAKSARLKVTDMLWLKIMSGLSTYFSKLRGTPSVVSRGDNGFVIDGKKSRLSGSTLDVLGLALRICVCKVFTRCDVLLLDEPSAGCDSQRTALMTSALASSGFEQIILISHKDIDDFAWANNCEHL